MTVRYTEREELITRRVSLGFASLALVGLVLFFSDNTLSEKALFEMYGAGYEDLDEFVSNPSFKISSGRCFILRCVTVAYYEDKNPRSTPTGGTEIVHLHHWRWGHVYKVLRTRSRPPKPPAVFGTDS